MDQEQEPGENQTGESLSRHLHVTWDDAGNMGVAWENISPVQLLTAAAWLDWQARAQLDTAARQTQPRILVPGDHLGRGGKARQ